VIEMASDTTRNDALDLDRRRLLRAAFWATAAGGGAGVALALGRFLLPPEPAGWGGVIYLPPADLPVPGDPPRPIRAGELGIAPGYLGRPEVTVGWLVWLPPGGGVPAIGWPYWSPELDGARPAVRGGLLALAARCPAEGCTVVWRPERDFLDVRGWFGCPCCGGLYTAAGYKAFGRAPRPLSTLDLRFRADGWLRIDTARPRLGGLDNALRALRVRRAGHEGSA
jgi:hypothetical protein